jgi:hypothetical protein
MIVNKSAMMGALIGWFVIGNWIRAFSTGSLRLFFNVTVDSIIGIGVTIAFGYFVGWRDRRLSK